MYLSSGSGRDSAPIRPPAAIIRYRVLFSYSALDRNQFSADEVSYHRYPNRLMGKMVLPEFVHM